VKFRAEAPPRVHLSAALTASGSDSDVASWEFACEDNGIGIEPQYADKIFVIFQRLHGRDVYSGTGIGLAMCKKIVEYHGGRLWLDTTPREAPGAVFRWTLPERQPSKTPSDDDLTSSEQPAQHVVADLDRGRTADDATV
jgi:light-regulated signal transduction histidine kinase (bacteriophytochrome)